MKKRLVLFVALLWLCNFTVGYSAEVSLDQARVVAQNWLHHYIATYKTWAGSDSPTLTSAEFLRYQDKVVGYNFLVSPKGHIVVPARDELPPVKLHSDTSAISVTDNSEVTRWLQEELFKLDQALNEHAQEFAGIDLQTTQNGRLWALFKADRDAFRDQFREAAAQMEFLSVGPLITTTWAQSDPYWLQTPLWYTGAHTLTGCVATAAAQIMRYWNYPTTGQGSTSYTWNNGMTDVTLSRDFSTSTYDWANMLASYSGGAGTTAQKNAVAKLMADVGIAFHMGYGTAASGAATMYGTTVYPTYFKYKSSIQAVYRTSYASDSAWMKVFQTESQAGRPSQLRINDPSEGGHSVVVDGYRDSPSEQIHLNMGWSGSYDGWYASNNIVTGSYTWSDINYQGALIGIEPEGGTAPPAAALVSPSGTITDTTPTYTWNAVSTATWYYLWVNDSTGTKIQTWYTAAQVGCGSGTGTCSVTPSTVLATGGGQWWIQTYNDYGYGPWSIPLGFTIYAGPPPAATLVSPSGTITDTTPTHTWNAVSNSTWYYLWVNDSTGTKIQFWYTAAQAGCASGTGTCSVTPSVVLATGAGQWWVLTWNSYGYGPWSSTGNFTVTPGVPPLAATLVSPSGTITDTTPTYTWNAVSTATWYYLWVNDSTSTKIQTWYTAAEVGCGSGTGTCSVTPSTVLATGAGQWWVQTWNNYGYGPWSSTGNFTVTSGAPPPAATLVSPLGTITDTTPTYTWNAVSTSTWYGLWVDDSTGTKIQTWYTAAEVGCGSGTGTCSVTPSTVLATGAGQWWVLTWNIYGYGPWSSTGSFTVTPGGSGGFNSQFNGDATNWWWLSVTPDWLLSSSYYYTYGAANVFASTYYGSISDGTTTFGNFDYQARLWRYGCETCSNGIMVRGFPSPLGTGNRWNSGYSFFYSRAGQYSIWKYTGGVASALVSWTTHSAVNAGDAWNVLRVVANAGNISFYMNGTLLATVMNAQYTSGKVGLIMFSDGNVGDVYYADWATLTPITTSAGLADGQGITVDDSLLHPLDSRDRGAGMTGPIQLLSSRMPALVEERTVVKPPHK